MFLVVDFVKLFFPESTIDVVYTWIYGGSHIITTICANEMKLCVYNTYVLKGWRWGVAALCIENSFEYIKSY